MNRILIHIKIYLIQIFKFTIEKPILYLFAYLIKIKKSDNSQPIRSAPHFLVIQYEFYSGDPSQGKSAEDWNVKGPLVASGLATFDTFYWDSDFKKYLYGDWKLLLQCATVMPDAIVLSSYDVQNYKQASLETIRIISKVFNIPIIAFWWDTCWEGFWEYTLPVLPYISVNIIPDNNEMSEKDAVIAEPYLDRILYTWVPIDPLLYQNPNKERDIGISFYGRVGGYRSSRIPYLQYLEKSDVSLHSFYAQETQPTHDEYVDALKRSKIVLNFSDSVDRHQLKGRVFEAIQCGALLLESENEQIQRFFISGEEYVSFCSEADLVSKAKYYLAHEEERAAIAARGEKKARECYSSLAFWENVMVKLELITKKDCVQHNS